MTDTPWWPSNSCPTPAPPALLPHLDRTFIVFREATPRSQSELQFLNQLVLLISSQPQSYSFGTILWPSWPYQCLGAPALWAVFVVSVLPYSHAKISQVLTLSSSGLFSPIHPKVHSACWAPGKALTSPCPQSSFCLSAVGQG